MDWGRKGPVKKDWRRKIVQVAEAGYWRSEMARLCHWPPRPQMEMVTLLCCRPFQKPNLHLFPRLPPPFLVSRHLKDFTMALPITSACKMAFFFTIHWLFSLASLFLFSFSRFSLSLSPADAFHPPARHLDGLPRPDVEDRKKDTGLQGR